MAQPTVVSAYYPIKSKSSIQSYIRWILEFWPKVHCPLVFYTDPQIVSYIESMFQGRETTKVVGVPFQELRAFTKLSGKTWFTTHCIDPEKEIHSPELYAIWYEKKEFVLRTMEMNPFGSDHFIWCDAGICRYPEWIPYLHHFPRRDLIPSDKMLLLRIHPFEGVAGDDIPGMFDSQNTVGGGILAGDRKAWITWSKAYDVMLMKYYLAGRFIGKDQNIMASMILKEPDIAVLVDPPTSMNVIQRWFYLLFFLGGVYVD